MTLALFSTRTPAQQRSLRRAAGLGLGLLSLGLTVGQPAHAGTVNWDKTPGDWFANPTHWDNGSIPGAGDDAVNMSTAAITLGQSTTINSFFSNGAFTLSGGTFSGNQAGSLSTITVNNTFTVDGGTINNFTVNQGTGGSLVFTGSGNNFIANSIINSSIDMATNANAFAQLSGAVTENGTINLGTTSNGLEIVYGGSSLTLGSSGSLTGFGNVFQYQGTTLTNNGTVNANSSGNALNLNISGFTNTGIAEATNGGTLNLSNTLANSGALNAIGANSIVSLTGTLTGSAGNLITASGGGQVQANGVNLLGTLNEASGTALVFNGSGNNFINNGTAAGTTATINGNLDLATNANAFLEVARAVTENGTINLGTTSNGLEVVYDGSSLTLGSGGSLTGFGNVFQYQGTTLTNNGAVNANSSGNALTIGTSNFTNTGTAEATNGGTLSLTNTIANSGLVKAIGPGSIVGISGTFTGTGDSATNLITASGGGQVQVNGANLLGTINTDSNTALVFNGSGNNFINNGGSGATINGNLDLATNASAFLQVAGAVTENGTINLGTTSNGLEVVYGGSSLTLGSGGSLTGFGNVFQYQGTSLTNNGTVNANSSSNPLTLAVTSFNNNGMTEATNGGTLNLNNTNTTNSGTLAAKSGGIVNIAGTFTGSTSSLMDGVGGTFNVNGANLLGTINEASGTALVFNGNGNNFINNGGSGATINGNLDLATNASAFLQVAGAVTENGNINLGTTSNGLEVVYDGSSLTLGSGGSLTGFGNVFQYQGTTLTNNGAVNANSSGNALTIGTSNFTNTGTAEATNGGTLSLTNTIANSGLVKAIGPGSIVGISGTFTGTGDSATNLITASGGGQVQVNGANLLGTINTDSNTALVFNGSGNNFINNGGSGATINGNLDLATNASAFLQVAGAVTENGNINLGTTSNGLEVVYDGSNLTLGANGGLTGFGTVSQYQRTTLTNNGTVNATGGTLNINNDNFVNTGTTQVQNGAALTVTSANTDSGNILVKSGGTATFSQGVTQTAGLTQVDGTLNSPLTLTGGTLQGAGMINGNVVNTGGTVAAGNPLGTLAVTGTFTQASGGALDAQFTGTANSLLSVSGLVTTDGALNVNYLDTIPYTLTQTPFTFLSYGTLATTGTNAVGLTQYFTNEVAQTNDMGTIAGQNGFTYELINNTAANSLQLEVLTAGAPVPEASTTISLGLLLALGGAGLWRVKRRTVAEPK